MAVITPKVKHTNNGKCEKCKEIFERYPNFNKQLRSWFVLFQAKHHEFHISCAGRGFTDQEAAKQSGNSKASYGKSAHNYNCAIDLFIQLPSVNMYDEKHFNKILAPEIPYFLKWYGEPGSAFRELPHVELRDWRKLLVQNLAQLVEEPPKTDVA